MVYFEQHVVLPPATETRVDQMLEIIGAIYLEISRVNTTVAAETLKSVEKTLMTIEKTFADTDTTVAVDLLKSAKTTFVAIEKTFANLDPIYARADLFIHHVGNLTTLLVLLLLLLIVMAVLNTVLCYLMWQKNGGMKCQCIRDEAKKLK
ncbi:hypothetical protein P153DRAFT_394470 [Dothidotthia symphoricarpi CBS 119687]|uniref:Uncharacterized protein n=1 Tax=Dothidotthia symphoricarpi CBS 119687 TaxID=1392245 RepID=A0A6A6AMB6_9PLEO|nr:uncharacterized protein P153DRAFT_394470 [Dothidotthia symphoricarpi CBS 119687]KAF2132313.1 hypothetical protein P153DRAFT_394470 [Dothidotthia symphoricarpi CBS 119687]